MIPAVEHASMSLNPEPLTKHELCNSAVEKGSRMPVLYIPPATT
jgi:hypothetical protein